MSSFFGSHKKETSFLSQHSLSSPNVLEYLTSPPPASSSSPDIKIRSTILPGRRSRSPSPTPVPYPGYVASGMRVNPQGYSTNSNLNASDSAHTSSSHLRSQSPLMSNYLGDCVKYPTNRNYGSNINKQKPSMTPTRVIEKPGSLLPDNKFCLSCFPSRLQFSAAMVVKQLDPDAPGEVRPHSDYFECSSRREKGEGQGRFSHPWDYISSRKLLFISELHVNKFFEPFLNYCIKHFLKGNLFQVDRDYIGFATLPEQIHRKSVKKGFDFTLMVVGESGLGKSTLVNSLFLSDLYKDRKIPDVSERVEKTTTIEKKSMDIEERGVKLRLTVVDTPGYGDAINGEESWRACCAYIDEQMRQYFQDESGLNRKNIQDNRIHCCVYFVPPYGHGLRQLDIEFMKRLHRKVNIVPVIAKADTLTASEVKKLKERIMADIEEHEIQIYQFPECDSDEDEEFKQQDRELKASVPFAVIGSNIFLDINGKQVRGRQYPWGIVEVENPKHSDFVKLRNMLICTHMHDLKDITQDVHYENFRAQCISQISKDANKERSKLKRDSTAQLEGLSETDRLLLEKDEEIRRMQDMLKQMQEKLHTDSNKRDSVVNV